MIKLPKTPNDDLDKFLLRMPDGLRNRIREAADQNGRSMNAEVVSRLEFSLIMHDHAYLIRALLDLQEDLIVKHTLEMPEDLSDLIDDRAAALNMSPNEFMNMLIRAAISELDNKTEVGKKLADRIDRGIAAKADVRVKNED